VAIDLKITTGTAEASLAQVKASIEGLRKQLNTLGSNKSLEKLGTVLANMKGPNPQIVSSIEQLQRAVESLNQSAAAATAMNQMSAQVAELSRKLAGLTPAATAAEAAMKKAAQEAREAARQFSQAQGAVSRLTGLMAAFGLSLSASSFSSFISDSLEALQTVQKFDVQMKNLGGPKLAAQQMEFLQQTAKETGQPLEGLVATYGKFAQSALYAGKSTQDVASNFYKLAATFRVMGLSSEESKRAFTAFEQIISKGKVQLQELRGQLGNAGIPAFSALSIAVSKSTSELEKMASKGQLTGDMLQKLIDKLFDMTKGGLKEALLSIGAVFANWQTALFNLQTIFAASFFDKFRSGLQSLTTAVNTVNFRHLIEQVGSFTGVLGSVALYAIESFMTALSAVSYTLSAVGQGFAVVGSYLYSFAASAANAIINTLGLSSIFSDTSRTLEALGYAAKLVVGAFLGWLTIMSIVWAVQAAMTLFAGLMALLSSRAALMALSTAVVIAALWGLTAVALSVSDALGYTAGAYDQFVGKSQEAAKSALDMAKALPGVTIETAKQGEALQAATKSHEKFAAGVSGSIDAQKSGLPIWGYTTEAVSRYRQETDRAYEAGQRQVEAIIAARGGMDQYAITAESTASANHALASSFDGLASSASGAASSIQAVQMVKTTHNSGGSGGNYALSAAKALVDYEDDAEKIARRAMAVAAEVCVSFFLIERFASS